MEVILFCWNDFCIRVGKLESYNVLSVHIIMRMKMPGIKIEVEHMKRISFFFFN